MRLAPAWKYLGIAIVLAVLILVPPIADSHYITAVFISVLLFFILGAIFDFMLGFLNIFNFGMGGFMALGAYTSALLAYHYGISQWLGLLAGGVATLLLGLFAGVITLRLRGIYVGLTTLFLAEFVLFAISNMRDYTRGAAGLQVFQYSDAFGISFNRNDPMAYYYLLLILCALIYLLMQGGHEIRVGGLEIADLDSRVVKFAGEPGQGLVAFGAHRRDDRFDPLHIVAEVGFRAHQQSGPPGRVELIVVIEADLWGHGGLPEFARAARAGGLRPI